MDGHEGRRGALHSLYGSRFNPGRREDPRVRQRPTGTHGVAGSRSESIRLLRRHLKQSQITADSLFRGDPRYGGSPLPLDYSVLRKAWQKFKQAGVQRGPSTNLRHSRATQLIQAGVPITTIRKQLGHRNLQSTLLYAEVDTATVKRDLLEYQRQKGKRV